MKQWERLSRKTLVDTPFLKVYEDAIRLPNGSLIPDFTVVKKRDIVVIVATDKDNRLITFREYKYAVGEALLTLPAGQIDGNETVEQAAERELLEETGYGGGEYTLVDILNEYPTKDLHTISVVRATNVEHVKEVEHEATETIGAVELQTVGEVKRAVKNGDWKTTSAIAALAITLLE
jgi:ADP-ribose pyrophosphatase